FALSPEAPLAGRLDLPRRRPPRRGEPPLGEVALDQPQAEIVPRALRQHLPRRQAGGGAHAPGQEAQAQPQARLVQQRCRRASQERVELPRSEEHTSELQSRFDLVCRLLLEKKKKKQKT